jgi:hypothetical protein
MSESLRRACQGLYHVANDFSTKLAWASPGDQRARLDCELAWVKLLDEVDACRSLPAPPPSPWADWLRATIAEVDRIQSIVEEAGGLACCIAGVPIGPACRSVTALRYPSLRINALPSATEGPQGEDRPACRQGKEPKPPTGAKQGEGEKPKPADADGDTPQYVTLDQMAALVNRSKKTLERAMNAANSDMPKPDVKGGGGRPHEWRWNRIRPWLETMYTRLLPKRFPTA